MKITAAEIAALTDGRVEGKSSATVSSAAPIEEAGPSDIAFVGNPKFQKCIAATRAGVILASRSYDFKDKTFVIVKNPTAALAKVLSIFAADIFPLSAPEISARASVSPSARLGKDVSVGDFAVVSDGAVVGDRTIIHSGCCLGASARIGADCVLHPSVTVYGRCVLGDRVIVHAGTVIGADGFGYIPAGGLPAKIPQLGIVKIGNDVEIGANAAIDRATMGATVIGDGTKIDNLVHIAHNVKIGRNCMLAGQVGFAGSVVVGDGVMMAGQAGINGHIEIGAGAVIAGQAGVIGDVPPGVTVSGFPARPHARMMRIYALMEKLPELYAAVTGKKSTRAAGKK